VCWIENVNLNIAALLLTARGICAFQTSILVDAPSQCQMKTLSANLTTYELTLHLNVTDLAATEETFVARVTGNAERFSSPDIIRQIKSRRMRWAGHVARMGERSKLYTVLVGKPAGKEPSGRPRRRWEDGIKVGLRENGWGGLEWIQLAQGRDRWRAVVNAVMNLRVLALRS
jgi:hypothetical protein